MEGNTINKEPISPVTEPPSHVKTPAVSKQSNILKIIFGFIFILSLVGMGVYIFSPGNKRPFTQNQLKTGALPTPSLPASYPSIPQVKQLNSPPVSILFIGNSFTSVNNLPETISEIARSLGDTISFDSSAPGGYTLAQHVQDQNTLSKIKSRQWDFVVIQEQSEQPALQASGIRTFVLPYALKLSELIRQTSPKAQLIFYETWGYENGDSANCTSNPNVCNYSIMQTSLSKSYILMAQKASGIVAPVGNAWSQVKQDYPGIELYQNDGRHPSADGTYLAACVLYKTLFNKSVLGAAPLNIPKADASILQQNAQQTE